MFIQKLPITKLNNKTFQHPSENLNQFWWKLADVNIYIIGAHSTHSFVSHVKLNVRNLVYHLNIKIIFFLVQILIHIRIFKLIKK